MPIIRFAWSPLLVELRREECPRASWLGSRRAWSMSQTDAERFLHATQERLTLMRTSTEIHIDNECWVVGFVQGAPYLRSGHPCSRHPI